MVRCDGVTKNRRTEPFLSDGSNSRSGITFVGALQVLFIGLKLAGVIDWSWWLVFSPFLIELGIIAFLLLLVGLYYLGIYMSSRD